MAPRSDDAHTPRGQQHRMIAIDIALLPEPSLGQYAVALSSKLARGPLDWVRLSLNPSPSEGLPHISLGMAVVTLKELEVLIAKMQETVAEETAVRAAIFGPQTQVNSQGGAISSLAVAPVAKIKSWHERVMAMLKPHAGRLAREQHLLPDDVGCDESALQWITHFAQKSAGLNFSPHLTLGYGTLHNEGALGSYFFDRIGIFRLGNGCTCRETLWTSNLISPGSV